MRIDALAIGLLMTVALAGCGERASKAERAAIERADRMNDQERRAVLARQAASGDKTGEEAACDDRLGLWDTERETCFDVDAPSLRYAAVRDAENACATATVRVTAQRGLPIGHVAHCDQLAETDALSGYYVLALRAHCSDELCGSTNMGWFAVQKATADVFEVDDIADWKLGRRVTGGS